MPNDIKDEDPNNPNLGNPPQNEAEDADFDPFASISEDEQFPVLEEDLQEDQTSDDFDDLDLNDPEHDAAFNDDLDNFENFDTPIDGDFDNPASEPLDTMVDTPLDAPEASLSDETADDAWNNNDDSSGFEQGFEQTVAAAGSADEFSDEFADDFSDDFDADANSDFADDEFGDDNFGDESFDAGSPVDAGPSKAEKYKKYAIYGGVGIVGLFVLLVIVSFATAPAENTTGLNTATSLPGQEQPTRPDANSSETVADAPQGLLQGGQLPNAQGSTAVGVADSLLSPETPSMLPTPTPGEQLSDNDAELQNEMTWEQPPMPAPISQDEIVMTPRTQEAPSPNTPAIPEVVAPSREIQATGSLNSDALEQDLPQDNLADIVATEQTTQVPEPVIDEAPAAEVMAEAQVDNTAELQAKDARIATLEAEVSALTGQIQSLNQMVQSQEQQLAEQPQDTQPAANDAQVEELQGTVSSLRSQVERLEEQLKQAQATAQQASEKAEQGEAPTFRAQEQTPQRRAPKRTYVDVSTPSSDVIGVKPATPRGFETYPTRRTQPNSLETVPLASSSSWVLRAAQPGVAWVSQGMEAPITRVSVGENIPGIGTVQSVSKQGALWVVIGSNGRITQ